MTTMTVQEKIEALEYQLRSRDCEIERLKLDIHWIQKEKEELRRGRRANLSDVDAWLYVQTLRNERTHMAVAAAEAGFCFIKHNGGMKMVTMIEGDAYEAAGSFEKGMAIAAIRNKAQALIAEAEEAGVVLRIDVVAREPLAMGHVGMVADVRPARKLEGQS